MKQVILLTLLMFCAQITVAQNNSYETVKKADATAMVLEGRVVNEKGIPVAGVNIEGKTGRYATTDRQGKFVLPANIGEEIIVKGVDFETVYYRIKNVAPVEIKVKSNLANKKNYQDISYQVAMDSAQIYLKKDAQKTADFLIAALSNTPKSLNKSQESDAYEKLGDLYSFNKQYDLAIDYYSQALQLKKTPSLILKKADVLRYNGNYQEAIAGYLSVDPFAKTASKSRINNDPTAVIELKKYMGLAAAYEKTNETTLALNAYKKALEISKTNQINTHISAINTSIAALYNNTGRIKDAESFYNTAIEESKTESPVLNVITQAATADFYRSNAQYEKEILLRKSNIDILNKIENNNNARTNLKNNKQEAIILDKPVVINDIAISEEDMEVVAPLENENTGYHVNDINQLSKQKEQFSIAQALQAQNKINEAIAYYNYSLDEATEKNDLNVKKDAAKSLYELYKKSGEITTALTYNDIYINAIDAQYLKKEEELQETTRKAKELIAQQTRILTLEKDRELTENKIALINTEKELTQEMNQRQRWVIYSLIALSLLLLVLAYFMYRNNKQQKINNHLLALKSLRSQMNPHFIFNALNSVNNYIAQNDERAANKYLADFSKLMRSVLENSELDFIPLNQEIELLNLYLKLEHERFKDKFDFTLTVDPALDHTVLQVPPMLLQPIIENAVWHGLRYKEEKGYLNIAFAKAEQSINVTIIDNGIGRDKSKQIKTEHQKKRDSKGLGNIKNRVSLLNELHDCHISIAVNDAGLEPDIGTKVIVTISKKV
jgi:tetratricopeptide (TPR) repeat protein